MLPPIGIAAYRVTYRIVSCRMFQAHDFWALLPGPRLRTFRTLRPCEQVPGRGLEALWAFLLCKPLPALVPLGPRDLRGSFGSLGSLGPFGKGMFQTRMTAEEPITPPTSFKRKRYMLPKS